MNDLELDRIETRLRQSSQPYRPNAPDSLVRYIDEVPARVPPAGNLERLVNRRGVRRGIFAVAAAAALVVGLVAGQALISIRNEPRPAASPSNPTGWTWQRADGTSVSRIWEVARGYIGTCHLQTQETDTASRALCSSTDGAHWQTPADPRIVFVADQAQFTPLEMTHLGSTYVAASVGSDNQTPASAASKSSRFSLWRSTDGGYAWSKIQIPTIDGLVYADLTSLGDVFVAAGSVRHGDASAGNWVFTSTDGLDWTRSSEFPIDALMNPAGAEWWTAVGDAGVMASTEGKTWRTLDGKSWQRIVVPAGYAIRTTIKTPDGYIGFANLNGQTSGVLVRSDDGSYWQVEQESAGYSLAVFPGRMVTSRASGPGGPLTVWESTDWGRSWHQLLDPAGKPMTGRAVQIGDRLGIASETEGYPSQLVWVGTPG